MKLNENMFRILQALIGSSAQKPMNIQQQFPFADPFTGESTQNYFDARALENNGLIMSGRFSVLWITDLGYQTREEYLKQSTNETAQTPS
ncbi:MAG TPA: hypothetical protein VFI61_02540 [Patescibacteria group bacterium]|nr:hypothetical protein [Patescibacteria group bacterium]